MAAQAESSAELTAREFNRRIADPEQFSGGGGVAAMGAAGAASAALLVMRLNLRRRSNATRHEEIEAGIAVTEATIEHLYRAADNDLLTLSLLLDAQRQAKQSGQRAPYIEALFAAAESPIGMAREIEAILDVIAPQVPLSTRFTVSDLAAAAVILNGAARAALVTAEVNLALLADEIGVERVRVARALDAVSELRRCISARADDIERQARAQLEVPQISTQASP